MKNQENLIDSNLQASFENFLMSAGNMSKDQVGMQINEIQANAMNILNSNDPEIQQRLDLIEEIDPQELNDELQYLIKELSTNQYTPEEQMEISNSLFNIFGFNIELGADNEVQINLIEPTIDDLEEEEGYEASSDYYDDDDSDGDLDDIYDDFEDFTSVQQQAAAPQQQRTQYAAPTNNATYNSNKAFDDFDFDY